LPARNLLAGIRFSWDAVNTARITLIRCVVAIFRPFWWRWRDYECSTRAVSGSIAHLAYNAGLTALPLLRAGQPFLVANGALVVVILLVPAMPGAIRLLKRRFGAAAARKRPAIRSATGEDLAHLSLFVPDEAWPEWLADPASAVVGLWAGGDLIGAAAGQVQPDGTGRVAALFVTPEWRRHYWGSRLAWALVEDLRGKGARSLLVTVPAGDWLLARFWDAQGWSPEYVSYAYGALKAD